MDGPETLEIRKRRSIVILRLAKTSQLIRVYLLRYYPPAQLISLFTELRKQLPSMAGGVVVSAGGRADYPGKLTPYVIMTCIIAATGGLIFGYDIGISGKSDLPRLI
ncbi:hypothetical protein ACLOJK_039801 [Asimina triloba]